MNIVFEITKATNKIANQAFDYDKKHRISEIEIKEIEERVFLDYKSKNYDFSKPVTLILKQDNGTRRVKKFSEDFSAENILCLCIKQILDKRFKISYPNRNKISRSLFNALGTIKEKVDFTIVKFDFKDYFNTLSSVYVYEKIIKSNLNDRYQTDLIEKYVRETKFAYAGLSTSNVIAEIIGILFDEEIKKNFSSFGLFFYERYIDDGFIILNEYLPKTKCEEIINDSIDKVFYDKSFDSHPKCVTKLNLSKLKCITRREMIDNVPYEVSFLGYEFYIKKDSLQGGKIILNYGITVEKRDKYRKRLKELIELYNNYDSPDYNNLELLRHRLMAFSRREVYLTKKFKSNIWKVKGFISSYGELRYFLKQNLVEINTKNFLENAIIDAFNNSGLPLPYFLKGESNKAYSLYHNMLENRTLLFEPHIGYCEKALNLLCEKIGIPHLDSLGNKRDYDTLLRDYLIKIKVGY